MVGTFSASAGWLHRFKKRHGIRELAIQGKKLSADEVGIVDFCYDLENIIKEYDLSLDQIYNADETACDTYRNFSFSGSTEKT